MMRAESLRERRQRLGLTQADLARRAGTSQSAVAAYESGAKVPSSATQQRLDRCLSPLPRQVLADHRAKAVRVFGSVASDIDLLVDFDRDASLFDLGGLQADLEELLSPYRVDVVSTGGLLPRDEHIRAEARPI